jgi:hypothetical protein
MVGLYFDLRICVLYKSPTSNPPPHSPKPLKKPSKNFFFGRPSAALPLPQTKITLYDSPQCPTGLFWFVPYPTTLRSNPYHSLLRQKQRQIPDS